MEFKWKNIRDIEIGFIDWVLSVLGWWVYIGFLNGFWDCVILMIIIYILWLKLKVVFIIRCDVRDGYM